MTIGARTAVFRHILVPTDGSPLARKAIEPALRMARGFDARITAICVIRDGVPNAFSAGRLYGSGVLGKEYRDFVRREVKQALGAVREAAQAAGVKVRGIHPLARHPWEEILRAAKAGRCDVIVMASHGWGAGRSLLLGSETMKVLAHSKIPVLVCR